jgi:hypothetical protein
MMKKRNKNILAAMALTFLELSLNKLANCV